MAEELLSLKWNNHQAHFVDILTFLREQEIFVDATLACGGKLYPAHKFVLSTCSDYFKQMFTKNPSKHPIVFMKDVSCRDLEALLDFMYNGEVNVPQSSLGSLIKTAEGLQIKGLAVPDDPPTKRERKDTKSSHDSHHSPPPKRRARDRSPPLPLGATHSSSSHTTSTPTASKSRSPPPPPTIAASSSSSSSHSSQSVMPPVEATLDEDSRTSVHSGQSEQNTSVTTPSLGSKPQPPPPPVSNQLSSSSQENQQTQHDASQSSQGSEEPSPGPSGLHRSKEEVELDIKQEDFVEIGDEDEGDWGVEGEGGGDSSMGSENPPNFPEVMLPTDGSVPPAGDPAMTMRLLLGDLGAEAAGAARPGQGETPGASGHHHQEEEDPDGVLGVAGGVAEGDGDPRDEDSSSSSSKPPGDCVVTYCYVQDDGYLRGQQQVVLLGEAGRVYGTAAGGGGGVGVGGGGACATGGGGRTATGRTVRGPAGLWGSTSQMVPHSSSSSSASSSSTSSAPFVSPQHPVLAHAAVVASSATIVVPPNTTPSSGVIAPTAQESGGSSSSGGRGKGSVYACRPFACNFCLKRFKRRDHLVEHGRTHTGERPYMCAKCGRSFAKKTNLNSHMKSHHRV